MRENGPTQRDHNSNPISYAIDFRYRFGIACKYYVTTLTILQVS